MKKNTAILHPFIAHYRNDFFRLLNQKTGTDIYVFEDKRKVQSDFFQIADIPVIPIRNVQRKGVLWYNPFALLKKEYKVLVLMLHFAHLTTWLLLVTKFIHRKKIILWGQGISVKRYLKEEKKPDWKLKKMMQMSDVVWLYMEKEQQQWQKILPGKKINALKNTISGVERIASYKPVLSREEIKKKYNITQPILLIFCARFSNAYRRPDLLESVIQSLDVNKFGFIIIGDGEHKPDFTAYSHVYEFGAVYDFQLKSDLFFISDIYFQPAWVGLSIVEAMAYGKPILTFKRTAEILQCVEYSYIFDNWNGKIVDNILFCVDFINQSDKQSWNLMGQHAREYVLENLTPELMAKRAINSLTE